MIKLRKDRIVYIQVGNHLLKRIANKEFEKGNTIGTVRSLANDYQVTTKTIQKVVDYLEKMEAISRIQSSGLYVTITALEAKKRLLDEAKRVTKIYIEEIKSLSNLENLDELIKGGIENDKTN